MACYYGTIKVMRSDLYYMKCNALLVKQMRQNGHTEVYFIDFTCGGHSHFLRKSSLALAKNSFTKKSDKNNKGN